MIDASQAFSQEFTRLLEKHIDNHKLEAEHWPDSAQYAYRFRSSTWPTGWSPFWTVRFFDTYEGAQAWYDSMVDWSRQSDNDFECELYTWDLGPALVA